MAPLFYVEVLNWLWGAVIKEGSVVTYGATISKAFLERKVLLDCSNKPLKKDIEWEK